MCTKRDRAKLINSGTLSVDFINIDVCAATLFFAFFSISFRAKKARPKDYSLCTVTAVQRKQENTCIRLHMS